MTDSSRTKPSSVQSKSRRERKRRIAYEIPASG
jgi:hypothetical protein